MSLLSVLKTIGKDLGHVGNWIDDGLKVIQPIATLVDPPLGPIFTAIENALDALERIPQGVKVDAGMVQKIITSATTIAALKPACPCGVTITQSHPFVNTPFIGQSLSSNAAPLLVGRDTPNGADQPKEAKTCA